MKKKKTWLLKAATALTLTVSSIATTSLSVFAEEQASNPLDGVELTTYENNGYQFEKISHPTVGVSQPDGIVDYIGNGDVTDAITNIGDRGQSYSWSAVSYGDYVYVGTCYAAMGNTLTLMDSVLGDKFDKETMEATLNTMFNGTFFYGQEDGIDSEGILVKVNVKTGEVKLLMSESLNNQGPLFRNAIRFGNKLYFCGSVRTNRGRSGLPSIYEVDPENNDAIKCVYTGIRAQDSAAAYREGISTGIRGMAVYNNQLVISCVGLEGPYIMISSDPSSGNFTKIATKEDLYNYPAYHYTDSIYGGSIWEIVVFNGDLYVSLCTGTPDNKPDEHTMQSFAIVKGHQKEDGTWNWTPVVGDKNDGAKYTFGIDPERTRAGACNMIVYNDHLYIGEYEDIEIALEDVMFNKNVEFLAKNLEQSVSLYRMDKDENVELVMGDATTMFPNGGISGLGSGFGKHENQYIWQSTIYDGKLYFGTFDSSSLLEPIGQFTNGDLLDRTEEEWKQQLNYIKVLLELLFKKDATNNASAEVMLASEADDVDTLIDEAIAEANNRYSVSSIATYAGNANESIVLTDEERADLAEFIRSEDSLLHTIDASKTDELVTLVNELAQLGTQLPETGNDAFIDEYTTVNDTIDAIIDQLTNSYDKLKALIDDLINITKIDNLKAFSYVLRVLSTAERGFDLYVSDNGNTFTPITTNGFGDPYNHGLRVFATSDNWMVIGTANPFYGTQLWRMYDKDKDVAKKYTITFDDQKGNVTTVVTKEGEKVVFPANPAYDGLTFLGWFDAKENGNQVSELVADKDMTLYAQWKTNPSSETKKDDKKDSAKKTADTSDQSNILMFTGMILISLIAIGSVVKIRHTSK